MNNFNFTTVEFPLSLLTDIYDVASVHFYLPNHADIMLSVTKEAFLEGVQ